MSISRNLLIIGNYPPPFGGVPNHIERLTTYLTAGGWKCHVLSGGTSGNEDVGGVAVYKPSKPRKALAQLRQLGNRDFGRWLNGGDLPRLEPKFWRRYKQYADVGQSIIRRHPIDVIASYNLFAYSPVGAWLARRFDLPHVISNFGEVFKFGAMTRNKPFFVNVASDAARLISCSEHCGNSLGKLGINTPVLPLPYGVETRVFSPGDDPAQLRMRLGVRPGARVVLFVGRLGREMGVQSFLRAAEHISKTTTDVHFLMVGQVDDLADAAQQKAAATYGRVIVVCNAPYSELPLYYRLADVVAVPTHGDRTCSSLAAMEAMAVAKPVIAYAIGGIPEIITDGENGILVPPEDSAGLAAGIERLLGDPAMRRRLAENGHRLALERLDVDHCNRVMERELIAAIQSHER